ncbi:hypothetical protein PIROE2DRAFT_65842 [Piromyces sp. E2]|nr:hypothetical protein PIROE2DRAFT_65842 [Piromyces sp. E2]|eukprot:OUM69178.1 hypothetical protein PIROE2DRAFT_65842 [Piromyces sp. E2]
MFETECEKLEHLVIPSEMMANIEDDISMDIFSEDIKAKLNKAAQLLKNGEVVAIPTETVYGLAGNALDKTVVPKIFKAKNRPSDNPLIIHISSLKMLKQLLPNGEIPKKYIPVIHKYWPGPLTIILPKSSKVPDVVTGGQQTMAVRFPKHPIARALISLCGFPLAAPSANSSGKPSPTLASHVYNDLSGKIPLIIDGGACNLGVESTVLDGIRTPPAILRPGSVTFEKLRVVPGMENVQVYRRDFVDKKLEQVPTTPGMKYRHYSPDAEVILIESNVNSTDETYQEKRKCIQWQENIEYFMGDRENPADIARELFKALRFVDKLNVSTIFVEGIEDVDEGLAIMNRIRKASSKIIKY